MSNCRSCGASLEAEARFCSSCGLSVDPSLRPDDSVELLGEAAAVESVVDRGGGWRTRLYAAAALVVVGALAWSMVSGTGENDGSQSELTEGESASDETGEVDEGSDSAGVEAGSTTSWTGTTTWPPSEDSTVEADTSEVEVGPLLGEPVGYSLIYGTESGPLQILDLDTGMSTEFETRGVPLYATSEYVVVARSGGGVVEVLSLDDIDGERHRLQVLQTGPWGEVHEGPTPGTIWHLGGSYERMEWRLTDLATGEQLESIEMAPGFFGGFASGPEVMSAPSGGVFVLESDSFQQVLPTGQVLAANGDYALIQQCSSPLDCVVEWWDRATWTRLDMPIPERPIVAARLEPTGRLLTYFTAMDFGVLDLETGEELAVANSGSPESVSVSPDGHYAAWVGSRLQVWDLDEQEAAPVDAPRTGGWGRALFIENR